MRKLLVVGLPFFAKKYNYMVDAYSSVNIHPKLLINSNYTNYSKEIDLQCCGTNTFKRMYKYLSVISKYRPDYIDCYDYSILTIYYILTAKILGIETRIWLIGGEINGSMTSANKNTLDLILFSKLKRRLTIQSLKISDKILAKELHHLESIEAIDNKLLKKVNFIHNAVPVNEHFNRNRKAENDFIYANAVIKSRNVTDLLSSFEHLKANGRKFTASMYGFNSISNEVYQLRAVMYSKLVLDIYNHSNIKNEVSVHGFIKDIKSEMLMHKFFILPGDVIFANYALLEAMSLGLVPIVYPGNGYERIVTDGVNGIVVSDNNLTLALERALNLSEAEYLELSEQAFLKIYSEFSLKKWASKLAESL